MNLIFLSSLDEVDKYYKCQEPKLPVANTAVFVKDEDQNLHYKLKEKDNSDTKPLFYASAYLGDSGSGVFRQEDVTRSIGNIQKSVLLAAQSMVMSFKHIAERSLPSDICKFSSSKLTEEFITWMKEQDRKYEKRGNFKYRNKPEA